MTYEEARAYIDECGKYGSVLGLDTETELLRRLGNPQDKLKFVHIAGTNGKGSLLAFVSTVLTRAGYLVGRYLSPAVFSYRERISVSGENIPREAVAGLTGRIRSAAEAMTEDGFSHPTVFELETALAFLYFEERHCDIVVLECGMGGLTDATNVVKNTLVCAFTEIGLDHREYLGDTVEEIAGVKAGILKPGAAAVSARQKPSVSAVLRKACLEAGVPFKEVQPVRDLRSSLESQTFSYGDFEELKITLSGTWQSENAALAVEVILALEKKGFPVREETLRAGLEETVWPGRFSVIDRDPLFVTDGAHNPDAADRLFETLNLYFPEKKKIFIIGVLSDKEYEYMLRLLAPLAERIIAVETPDNPRALPAEKLALAAGKYNPHTEAANSISDAVNRARSAAGKDDLILAFGSLSYLGELTRAAAGKQ